MEQGPADVFPVKLDTIQIYVEYCLERLLVVGKDKADTNAETLKRYDGCI